MLNHGNIKDLFQDITEYWSPKVIGEINDDYIKIAKLKGQLVWHDHQAEDEMFYVVKGQFDMQLKDQTFTLNEGDFYVVPKGVIHNPVAKEECWVLLVEKKETKHTGDVITEHTKSIEDQLY